MAARTVVVVSDQGRLIDVTGANMEASPRYAQLAKRLLGESGDAATLDYGWNGKDKLVISTSGNRGRSIELRAAEVVVPSTLSVGGKTLAEHLKISEATTLKAIKGTENGIDVTLVPNPNHDLPDEPDQLCILSISDALLDRLGTIEAQIDGIIRLDDVYRPFYGLRVDATSKKLRVGIGTGLIYEADLSDPTARNVAVDIDEVRDLVQPEYVIGVDSDTGNAILCHNESATPED